MAIKIKKCLLQKEIKLKTNETRLHNFPGKILKETYSNLRARYQFFLI